MYWQVIEKACFTEYQDCQCPNEEGSPVLRSIPVAVYRYYLLRHADKCVALLEQEHWGGTFVSFCTPRISTQEGRAIYNKMVSCGKNPENIQNMGIEGTSYENSLDITESDFGLAIFSEEDLEGGAPDESAPSTTSGYRPDTSAPETPWAPTFMRARPQYSVPPESERPNISRPIGMPGIPVTGQPPVFNTQETSEYAPANLENRYEEEGREEEISSLPDMPPLPTPRPRERNPLDLIPSPRQSSHADRYDYDAYEEEDEDDY